MGRKRLGELLLERGAITRAQLDAGLAAQQRTGLRLGATLIQMNVISEVQLAQALAQSLELATVDLEAAQVDWSAVHLLRARFCETHELFPFAIDKGGARKRVMVALSDPSNVPAQEEIEFTTGLEVAPYVSTHSQIRAAILRYYHKAAEARPPVAPARLPAAPRDDDPPMVVGQEIGPATRGPAARDLDFLFGKQGTSDQTETLEHRFWALLRVLDRKGLVSRDEFLAELGDADE